MTIAETPEETPAAPEVEVPEADTAVEEAADEVVAEEVVAEDDSDDTSVEAVVEEKPLSPYDLPGDWYVVHSYSGYENKVKVNLETRSKSMHMEDLIYEVVIPMEDVVEIKNGKKVTVPVLSDWIEKQGWAKPESSSAVTD